MSVVESWLVREPGHQYHPYLLSCVLLMMQLLLQVLGTTLLKATIELQQVTAECGLTISALKTKLMVAGSGIIETDAAPLCIGSSVIETMPSLGIYALVWWSDAEP